MLHPQMGQIRDWARAVAKILDTGKQSEWLLAGIPRGGIPAAYAIAAELPRGRAYVVSADELGAGPPLIEAPIVIVDDIVVTGKTFDEVAKRVNGVHSFVALVRKGDGAPYAFVGEDLRPIKEEWVQFPWEVRDPDKGKPEDAVRRLIEYVGDDPMRADLEETPKRVLRYLDEVRAQKEVDWVVTTFPSEIEDLQAMGNIVFDSLCEHHMLPYSGIAAIGYVPNGKLIGLSKLPRILLYASAGLTMQEEVTSTTAKAVQEATGSEDVAVVTTCSHTCMAIRGVKAVGATTSSSAMLGKFRDAPALRAEFMTLAGIG